MSCESEKLETELSDKEKQFLKTLQEGNTIPVSREALDRRRSGKSADMSGVKVTFTEDEDPEWAHVIELYKFFSSWRDCKAEPKREWRFYAEKIVDGKSVITLEATD